MQDHWSRTCHTLKYLVDLYQASLNDKIKSVEINFVQVDSNYGKVDMTHLDVADFLLPKGRIDNLIDDGNIQELFLLLFI